MRNNPIPFRKVHRDTPLLYKKNIIGGNPDGTFRPSLKK
ncbi:S-layer homology domain-containing protein [Bacillus sp. OxB-1]